MTSLFVIYGVAQATKAIFHVNKIVNRISGLLLGILVVIALAFVVWHDVNNNGSKPVDPVFRIVKAL